MRTQVLLAYADRPPVRLPVELTGITTDVPDARGRPAPAFVFANVGDYGYMLTRLDSASLASLEGGALGHVDDAFLRAMLWGALWDEVRAARMAPATFVRLAEAELPREKDEQIVPRVLARVRRAVDRLPGERRSGSSSRATWSASCGTARMTPPRRSASGRRTSTRTWGSRRRPRARPTLAALVSSDSAAGAPTGNPTRWDAVTRLLVLGAPDAERLLAAQAARDSSPDGRRRAFIAGAARGDSATKRSVFRSLLRRQRR